MATSTVTIRQGHDLIAVFRTSADAADASAALIDAGSPPGEIEVAADGDRAAVLDAEMYTEFGTGPLSWRALSTRHGALPSVLAMGAVGWVASAAIATVVALIDWGMDEYWERWVVVFAVVIALGTMVSILAIGGLATAAADPPLASERGTTVHVHHPSDADYELLMQLHPWRIDEVGDDGSFVQGVHVYEGRSMNPPGQHQLGWG